MLPPDLTADELRLLHARIRNEDTKRAIRRRLHELDNQPPAPKPQQQLKPGWERRVLRRLPPRTRTWWPLEDIAAAVDEERNAT